MNNTVKAFEEEQSFNKVDTCIQDITVAGIIRENCRKHKQKIALIDYTRRMRYTYRDLEKNMYLIEKAVIGLELQKGDKVALILDSSIEWIFNFMAMIDLGIIPVCIDPQSTSKEIISRIEFSNASMVITDEAIYDRFRGLTESELSLVKAIVLVDSTRTRPNAVWVSWDDFLLKGSDVSEQTVSKRRNQLLSTDPLHMQYTSGTTGTPKLVLTMNCRMASNVLIMADGCGYDSSDTFLLTLPLNHVMGCFYTLALSLMVGGTIVIIGRFKTDLAIKALLDEECSVVHAVPTMYKYILNNLKGEDFTYLKKGMIAGAYCDSNTVIKIRERLSLDYVFSCYGQTEGVCYSNITTEDSVEKANTTVGRATPGVTIKIVDEDLNDLGIGKIGEVFVHMPYRMIGYYKNQSETDATVIDGWIRTGDLGELDEDGYLTIKGRKKEIIIRGGENITPTEIEDIIREYHRVKDIVVVGIPDEMLGEEVVACIILADNSKDLDKSVVVSKIRNYISRNIAKNKAPHIIEIINEFPVTTSGKIQKFKLVEELTRKYGLS